MIYLAWIDSDAAGEAVISRNRVASDFFSVIVPGSTLSIGP